MTAQDREIVAAIVEMGLGEPVALEPISGGVSCDVWRVDLGERTICVKQALRKLRVASDWTAPVARSHAEAEWMRLVAGIDPALVPAILGEDRARHIVAMEYLPPPRYRLWKAELAAGTVNIAFAEQVGLALARIHAATAGRPDIAERFENDEQFRALRLEPYFLHAASRNPEISSRIAALVDRIAAARIALMHGDISPKNILCGPHGPVFLDAETACYGDPAFDLAFCLNHLLLKCVWHREHSQAYLQSFRGLAARYAANVTWEPADSIDTRAAALLPALLLARVDGKSPVEYLTSDTDRQFVRRFALRQLESSTQSTEAIADDWRRACADHFAATDSR